MRVPLPTPDGPTMTSADGWPSVPVSAWCAPPVVIPFIIIMAFNSKIPIVDHTINTMEALELLEMMESIGMQALNRKYKTQTTHNTVN